MDGETLLGAQDIQKAYGSTLALRGVDFSVRAGEVHALAGENGAGKSTLLKILSGLEAPTAGVITAFGLPHPRLTPSQALRLGIYVVRQQLEQAEELSVADNLFLGRWPVSGMAIDRRRLRDDSVRILQRFDIAVDPGALMGDLPYAQREMIEIARASEFFSPRVLILDEPTASLSVHESGLLFRVIGQLRAAGVGIIYVSHYLAELTRIADRITVLRDGRVVATETAGRLGTEQIVSLMVGPVSDLYPQSSGSRGETVLRVDDAAIRQLRNVTCEIAAGEVVGIAAPKGEGVSELFRAITGVSGSLEQGAVQVRGRPTRGLSASALRRRGVGYASEDRARWGLIRGRSIGENLSLSVLGTMATHLGLLRTRLERATVARLVGDFSVRTQNVENPIESLSGGNQQKVVLARLLASKLLVYVLDDPTFGVDVRSKAEINRLLVRVVEEGAGVLLHTSDLSELLAMSDRILLIRGGTLQGEFPRGTVSLTELEGLLEAEPVGTSQ